MVWFYFPSYKNALIDLYETDGNISVLFDILSLEGSPCDLKDYSGWSNMMEINLSEYERLIRQMGTFPYSIHKFDKNSWSRDLATYRDKFNIAKSNREFCNGI